MEWSVIVVGISVVCLPRALVWLFTRTKAEEPYYGHGLFFHFKSKGTQLGGAEESQGRKVR